MCASLIELLGDERFGLIWTRKSFDLLEVSDTGELTNYTAINGSIVDRGGKGRRCMSAVEF